ncbi:uncharacterized protein LOC133886478 [Phragmites australis]|uniref:uncharacterized protein LOC133886478 n=1 Tax=Phragmites australis TaxID=29695 RepID=UPI002D784AA8|nr:uncharacterized protein LOC133886478 [Phragmites australis]
MNLLSQEAFKKLQVPPKHLKPSLPFYGVTPGYTLPLGQVELPVIFGSRDNFWTEKVVFDVEEVPLPYNAILGRPTLARFMMATHYAYLTVKMPGPAGPISVLAEIGNAVSCAEQLYSALASALAEVEGHPGGPGPSSSKS